MNKDGEMKDILAAKELLAPADIITISSRHVETITIVAESLKLKIHEEVLARHIKNR